MNINELRTAMDVAFQEEGLEERRLLPKARKVWSLQGGDIIRFFAPQPYRRPWGFVYTGSVGIEIPALRTWLREHKPNEESGIFHSCFVSYLTLNDADRGEFMLEQGQVLPAGKWAGLLKNRLAQIPATLEGLVSVYEGDKDQLGRIATGHPAWHAWDFLLKWRANPDPSLHVPRMLPDGSIA